MESYAYLKKHLMISARRAIAKDHTIARTSVQECNVIY